MVAAPAIIGSARIRNDATSELRLCSTASPLGPRPNITNEEYHPYGTTAWWASASGLVSQKRYRYTGKEKDEETGLAYHGARYYAPWLARWETPDPSGLKGGLNRYEYCRSAPAAFVDLDGCAPTLPESSSQDFHPTRTVRFDQIDQPTFPAASPALSPNEAGRSAAASALSKFDALMGKHPELVARLPPDVLIDLVEVRACSGP